METVSILIDQALLMFILMLVGFVLFKIKMLDDRTTRALGDLILYVANPAIILISLLGDFGREKLEKGGVAVLISVAMILIGIAVGYLMYRSKKPLNRFAIIFCNNGFMGIPLIQNVMGSECVFYVAIFVAVGAVAMWTYGVIIVSGSRKEASLKKVITNPCIIAMVIGIVLGVTHMTLPAILLQTIFYLGNLNTPLAMMVLGCYLAESDVKKLLQDKDMYITSFGRLIAVPFVTLLMLMLVPDRYMDVKITLLIATSTPAAGSLAILCKKYDNEYTYGAGIVSITTLISLFTMPLCVALAYFV